MTSWGALRGDVVWVLRVSGGAAFGSLSSSWTALGNRCMGIQQALAKEVRPTEPAGLTHPTTHSAPEFG
mgnify:CR=1 FL=1